MFQHMSPVINWKKNKSKVNKFEFILLSEM